MPHRSWAAKSLADISDSRSLPCPPTERRISCSAPLLFPRLCVCAGTRGSWLEGGGLSPWISTGSLWPCCSLWVSGHSLLCDQLHWSCCCILSCGPSCWHCPFPRIPGQGWKMNQVSLSTTYCIRKCCKIESLFFLPRSNASLESTKVIFSQNRFTVVFEADLLGGVGTYVCFS